MSSHETVYDVCIVGAGLSGLAAAFHISKQGKNVLLLEKGKFPLDSIPSSIFSPKARQHLKDMEILDQIYERNESRFIFENGIVSPSGLSFVSNLRYEPVNLLPMSVKRSVINQMLIKKIRKQQVTIIEKYDVSDVKFMSSSELWQLNCENSQKPPYKARILIAADGSKSEIGQALGIVKSEAQAISTVSIIESGTHEFHEDEIRFYPISLLPGYCSILKLANGDLIFRCNIVVDEKSLIDFKSTHETYIETYPFVSEVLGASPKKGKMKSFNFRICPVGKSYSDNLLIIGSAAGYVDPLTFDGTQYALDSALLASIAVDKSFKHRDFSSNYLKRYQTACEKIFTGDLMWSMKISKTISRHPSLIDSLITSKGRRRTNLIKRWFGMMSGARGKLGFFMPGMALPLALESLKQRIRTKT